MKRTMKKIAYDIKSREKKMRTRFPRRKKGEKFSGWDYDYNISRYAIENTYRSNEYSQKDLSNRLNDLLYKKNVRFQLYFPYIISVSAGVFCAFLLDWKNGFLGMERAIQASTHLYLTDIFSIIFALLVLPLVIIFPIILCTKMLIKHWPKLFDYDNPRLIDYEIQIIKSKLSELEDSSFEEWKKEAEEMIE